MLDRVRAHVGRLTTLAGTSVLAASLATDAVTLPGIALATTTAAAGLTINWKILRGPQTVRGTAIALYCTPHTGVVAILLGEHLLPDTTASLLTQTALVALWTGATWTLRPGHLARQIIDQAHQQEITDATEAPATEPATVEPTAHQHPVARWWATTIAHPDGPAPGTALLDHQQLGPHCVALIIGATHTGKPVPKISTTALSALLDIPEEHIEDSPVPGRGAGVRLLVLGQRPQPAVDTALADADLWHQIAATAMPGVELIEATTYPTTPTKELT